MKTSSALERARLQYILSHRIDISLFRIRDRGVARTFVFRVAEDAESGRRMYAHPSRSRQIRLCGYYNSRGLFCKLTDEFRAMIYCSRRM